MEEIQHHFIGGLYIKCIYIHITGFQHVSTILLVQDFAGPSTAASHHPLLHRRTEVLPSAAEELCGPLQEAKPFRRKGLWI
jgi:hypothetical protein